MIYSCSIYSLIKIKQAINLDIDHTLKITDE